MKKNFILSLLAPFSIATAVAAVAPEGMWEAEAVATWNSNTEGTSGNWAASTNMDMRVTSNGNWSVNMTLDPKAMMTTFGREPGIILGSYVNFLNSGYGLFTVTGSGYRNKDEYYASNSTTFVMGWGNSWFEGVSNGVGQGFQMGVAQSTDTRYPMGTPVFSFEVYRFDTKLQNTDGWTLNEKGSGAATATTMTDMIKGTTISAADLTIVHSTDGDISTTESYTTMYLTVTLEDDEGNSYLMRYMAQIDDRSTYDWSGEGTLLSGSGPYDVDNFTLSNLQNINASLIDELKVFGSAVHVDTSGNLFIPEPTTATLSLLALTTLATRRRRRK